MIEWAEGWSEHRLNKYKAVGFVVGWKAASSHTEQLDPDVYNGMGGLSLGKTIIRSGRGSVEACTPTAVHLWCGEQDEWRGTNTSPPDYLAVMFPHKWDGEKAIGAQYEIVATEWNWERQPSLGLQKLVDTPESYLRRGGHNLAGADLHDLNLRYLHIAGVDFTRAYLEGTQLQGAEINNCLFDSARCQGTNLEGASIYGSSFKDTQLWGASFSNARITQSDFSCSGLGGANFKGATLSSVTLPQNHPMDRYANTTLSNCIQYVSRVEMVEDTGVAGVAPNSDRCIPLDKPDCI